MQFLNRAGQPINIDLFDSGINHHIIFTAQSVPGKSFMADDWTQKAGIIDEGWSYLKPSEAIDCDPEKENINIITREK